MSKSTFGKLYLIPVTLGDVQACQVLPNAVPQVIMQMSEFVVENSKVARKHIKNICPEKEQASLKLFELNKHTALEEIHTFLAPLLEGRDMGLLSDAGCPGVADPGAVVVKMAHEKGIEVLPLVGPSSILLALMGSGMNGQSFAFHGYLPIDKKERKNQLKLLEKASFDFNQAQLFIETPYRNNSLIEEMLQTLDGNTQLCIAADLTLPTQFLYTKPIRLWKKTKVDLHKRPAIFVLQKERY